MNCYQCYQGPDPNVPLLRCGHYICTVCYCQLKSSHIFKCLHCDKKLIRGFKKNRGDKK